MTDSPNHLFVVGVDPGLSTGLAVIRGDGWRVHGEQGPPSILDDFMIRFHFLTRHEVLVGCEPFVVTTETAKHSAQTAALEVIGVVKQLCRMNGWPLYLQPPSVTKPTVPNALLTDLGLRLRGRDVGSDDADDANDATRQALTVLAHHRAGMFDGLLRSIGV